VWARRQNKLTFAQTKLFNLLIDWFAVPPMNLSNTKGCFILTPRSQKENLRVQDRSKKASRQLRSYEKGKHGGIFCLGLSRHQDPHFVIQLIQNRFLKGQYSGISSVLLSRTGLHLNPPQRTYVGLFSVLDNPNTTREVSDELELGCVGVCGNLIGNQPEEKTISAYRYGEIEGLYMGGSGDADLPFLNILDLNEELLK
jgi:hypothetical protein